MAVGTRGKSSSKARPRKTPARGAVAKNGSSPRAHKWVYLFDEGNASMRDLLGGKGAGVAEMTSAGLPVPPGFTITTEACNAYYAAGGKLPAGLWDQVDGRSRSSRRRPARASATPRIRCWCACAAAPSSRCRE